MLADFIVVASRLLLIKSKAILPSLALTEEEETDIKDLEMRLKIYREFSAKGSRSMGDKNASIFLNDILQEKCVRMVVNFLRIFQLFLSFPKHNCQIP